MDPTRRGSTVAPPHATCVTLRQAVFTCRSNGTPGTLQGLKKGCCTEAGRRGSGSVGSPWDHSLQVIDGHEGWQCAHGHFRALFSVATTKGPLSLSHSFLLESLSLVAPSTWNFHVFVFVFFETESSSVAQAGVQCRDLCSLQLLPQSPK